MTDLHFFVVSSLTGNFPPGSFVLVTDRWDDFHYKTQFHLYYIAGEEQVRIGTLKIAKEGMGEDEHTELPARFELLDGQFFSLGQDREYYEALRRLPGGIGDDALNYLRDVAAAPDLFERFKSEPAFRTSLVREVTERTVTNQFRRIIAGMPPLTPYRFSYQQTSGDQNLDLQLEFGVHPGDKPPTNVHVLIGANGVGKSTLLRSFVRSVQSPNVGLGRFMDQMNPTSLVPPFANLIHISFSAFDPVQAHPLNGTGSVVVHPVGLQVRDRLDHHAALVEQFLESIRVCSKNPRRARWKTAMELISGSDRLLGDERLQEWLPGDEISLSEADLRERFSRLSSGHKIVILTMTRLIELVEEQSLVLLDEPETHLHPPLLSALTRAISDLVVDRNGVAIVATHSPVVLQEVPATCVWILQRSGDAVAAERPDGETFGESVSRLTSEVFRLDLLKTGYHAVLDQLLDENGGSAERVMDVLERQLGSEGVVLLSALDREAGRDA